MLRPVLAASAAVMIAATTTACGGDKPTAADSSSPVATTAGASDSASPVPSTSATPFDPPKKFEKTGHPVGLPGKDTPDPGQPQAYTDRTTLAGTTAVTADKAVLYGNEVATGVPLWSVPAVSDGEAATVSADSSGPPVTATFGGRTVVVAAFDEHIKGTGTNRDSERLSVHVIDPADGKLQWKADIPDVERTERVLIDEERGLIAVGAYTRSPVTTVIDANTQKVLWTMPGYQLVALGKGVVATKAEVDNAPYGVVGFDARTKQVRWRAMPWKKPTTAIQGIGGNGSFVVVSTEAYISSASGSSSEPTTRHVVDLASGRTVTSFKGIEEADGSQPVTCAYDGTSVLACSYNAVEAFGIDGSTGRKLWSFDNTGGRVPPLLTAAFHGVLYGAAQNTAVAMDAKTGQDIGDPGTVAQTVNEYGAASYRSDYADDVLLHAAIG